MIIFKIRIFKLPDIDQGIHKHAIEKKEKFLKIFKKNITRKAKKNPILVNPGLRYIHKKIKFLHTKKFFFQKLFFFSTKFVLRLKKKIKKILGENSKTL